MEEIKNKLSTILKEFLPSSTLKDYQQLTNGIINATYRVETEEGNFLLQRINTEVFQDPKGMMANIGMVTDHLKQKNTERGITDSRHTLSFLKATDGKNYYELNGEFWRLSVYIENTITLEEVTPSLMEKAGRAFGNFAADLIDFDSSTLSITIPGFHDTDAKIKEFYDTLANNAISERVYEAQYEINVIAYWKDWLKDLSLRAKNGSLPLRVTHNDTKTNNILFDKDTKEALAIIDLDTVMPSLLVYDIADAIRFSANTAAEDEPDTDKASLDLERFRAFLSGYLPCVKPFLTEAEKATLAKGIVTIVYEQGIRFLNDYIAGDLYYQISRPKQNLDRARCQFRLFEDMMAHYPVMERIIRECLK